jgi:hypothetical protein
MIIAHGGTMNEANQESQSEKFKRLARELECDESEERFDKALKRVAESPPPEKGDKSKKDKPGQ